MRQKVESCLERIHGEKYIEVGVEQMFGVFLLVYVRPSLADTSAASMRRMSSVASARRR